MPQFDNEPAEGAIPVSSETERDPSSAAPQEAAMPIAPQTEPERADGVSPFEPEAVPPYAPEAEPQAVADAQAAPPQSDAPRTERARKKACSSVRYTDARIQAKMLTAVILALIAVILSLAILLIALLPAKTAAQDAARSEPSAQEEQEPSASRKEAALRYLRARSEREGRIIVDAGAENPWGAAVQDDGTLLVWLGNDRIAYNVRLYGIRMIEAVDLDWDNRMYLVLSDGTVRYGRVQGKTGEPQVDMEGTVEGLENIVYIRAFPMSSKEALLAIDADGTLWAWGDDGGRGMLDPASKAEASRKARRVEGIENVVDVQVFCTTFDDDPRGTVLVRTASGAFYGWGTNIFGAFADDASAVLTAPTRLNFDPALVDVKMVDDCQTNNGYLFACQNADGRVTVYNARQECIDVMDGAAMLIARDNSIYLIDTDGVLFGIGCLTSGAQLTRGGYTSHSFTQIDETAGAGRVVAVGMGGWSTSALYEDGRISVWEQEGYDIINSGFVKSGSGADFVLRGAPAPAEANDWAAVDEAPEAAQATVQPPQDGAADAYAGVRFSATGLNGEQVDDALLRGSKLTMVNYWATWCGPCVGEMPELAQLYKDYAAQGLLILGVQLDGEDAEGGRAVAEGSGVTYPVVPGDSDLLALAGEPFDYIPATVFLDANGTPLGEVYIGSRSYDEWKEIVVGLLKQVG